MQTKYRNVDGLTSTKAMYLLKMALKAGTLQNYLQQLTASFAKCMMRTISIHLPLRGNTNDGSKLPDPILTNVEFAACWTNWFHPSERGAREGM